MEEAEEKKLNDDIRQNILERSKRNRLPVINDNGLVSYVLHRSFIDKFLVNHADIISDTTLKELLEDPEYKTIFQSFATVSQDAKLFTVKQAMDRTPNCADVFITEDGSKESRAIGWVTDVIVRQKSVA